ncbi:RNA-dependent RNA polymerase 1-like isoform X2 [Tripterygium wilfordii]|uniref:RNA-dependent RNA polymerase n=1 Tax=Tripterygium wilfordii TaxID=458696 RepID=A0A7J7DUY8_TRIWF|nr:probable RNA-dependent RNA polymerase 1 [Tripterygium wilfordii]XP_038688662.1 probable RNA-dependent RNA polymerase 1 [Tripterygium wilfordii]KAF5750099.1 RNA-dependent RNA polymerase 1-like isoform X2 [Tripterygium wilfordii]
MGKTLRVSGFRSTVSADSVKEFLELYTGEGTVDALKIRYPKNGGSRVYAIVQFTTTEDAELLADNRLRYGNSYLEAQFMDRDTIPKPRTFLHIMEKIKLMFGCQISKEMFAVLWERFNVNVKFGIGMKRFHFFMSYRQTEYKFDLWYENIWQIELRRPRGQNAKYLLIQLYGAPRIYEKGARSSCNILEDPYFNFFKDTPDDQWVRAVDFTPSCCIGQSSALCLELPHGIQLPNFQENFPYYTRTEGSFTLFDDGGFSSSLDLVPVVSPPGGIDLPYKIIFMVNRLVQHGCLPGSRLDTRFYRLVDPRKFNIVFIEHALEKLFNLKECCYEPSNWLSVEYKKYHTSRSPPISPAISLDTGLVYVRRVQITPCKVYFCGPEVNVSNGVLRNYPEDVDNFLRVSFVDEELGKIQSTDLSPRTSSGNEDRRTGIYERILSTLQNGLVIGDKKFEFLAFSSSQLKENSVWMFASRFGLTAADIRTWMGDFRRIRNVAKYAARLGQSFSSSTETLSVGRHEIEIIRDVEVKRGDLTYVFSDGIGKISSGFAREVAIKCGHKAFVPSAFQIRYGGYKGVVAVDPKSSKKLSLRKSMCKYESRNTKLDVLAYSKYQSYFLNRQLITLLSTLGVPDAVFERKQREAVAQLDAILTDPSKAMDALELMHPGETTNILKEMLLCDYKPDGEPFLSMMLQTFRASKLLNLRIKTKIYVQNGGNMMGCLDETRSLEYGQVFVQISGAKHWQLHGSFHESGGSIQKQHIIVLDDVFVAKNPCLHPGDVRVLKAVNVPALHHMVDCVVFPQRGPRPHPNECSGSDLDGDFYFVCWDPELIPRWQIPPMDYTPQPCKLLDHDVTIEEVEEYFTNYILNDSLGIISNAHIVFADREPLKAMSEPCLELAQKASIAVDFAKTGVPAEIPSHLRVKEFPDFMEKPDKPSYESRNVIGKLFREVKDIAPHTSSIRSFTREVARKSYDPDMEVDGFEYYIADAFRHKSNYDYVLGNYMDYYGIKTEAEIFGGSIMNMSKSFTKKRDAEAIRMAVRSLRKKARSWFNESSSDIDSDADNVYAKASAWYYVTYHHTYWGTYNEGMNRDHFLSFAWCIYDKLIEIKKRKIEIKKRKLASRRPSRMPYYPQNDFLNGFGDEFNHGLSLS